MGPGATAFQDPPEPKSIDGVKMRPVGGWASEPAKSPVGPTESEIAAAAYQLWLDNGCPAGSDREDWFRAEAALKRARRVTRVEAEMVVEIRCWGHWEVWEMEWGDPRWVWD